MEYSSIFVCLMGMGTVFFGLICLIALTYLMSAVVGRGKKAAPAPVPAAPQTAGEVTPELVAAVSAALAKECGVTERLSKTVQNELINIVTIFLGVSVGATATGTTFLSLQTIKIMLMGVVAFSFGTAGGVLLAKFMNLFLKEKINPLIGSAGVSAVPMAARVSQMVGQKYNPGNFLLMHAMGPNVAGVIGSAIAAGVLISLYG